MTNTPTVTLGIGPLRCIFLTVVITVCGCGRSSPDSSSAPPAGGGTAAARASTGTADACALLTAGDIAEQVKNPVTAGRPDAGPEVCKWGTEQPTQTSVLLMVRLAGSDREKVLCEDVRNAGPEKRLTGIGKAATWEFSRTAGLFNSGELEVCDAQGFVSVSLNGQGDEPSQKEAAMALARKVFSRL